MSNRDSKSEESSKWNTPRDPKLGEEIKNSRDSNDKKKR